MAESPRIEELKRRVQVDPASIAFAALAEEDRRAGRFEEAITACQAGLQRHPAYLSARVTLGRALLELGRFDEAREELEHVLRSAPENLAAIRGLAEIHHRRGELPEALEQYRSALHVAKHDAEIENAVNQISKQVSQPVDSATATAAHPADASSDGRLPAQPEPAPQRATEPSGRPHLELVTRARPPEPEPESEPMQQAAVLEAVSVVAPEHVVERPEESSQEAFHEAAMEQSEAFAVADPGRVEPEAEMMTPSEPLAVAVPQPDPSLLALEGLLGAILREKEHLASSVSVRR